MLIEIARPLYTHWSTH